MGHAIEKSDYVAARQRPVKALRQENPRIGNLSAFVQDRQSLTSTTSSAHSYAQKSDAKHASADYVKLGAQPVDQIAANSDSAFTTPESWIGSAPKNQLAIAIISCLSIGTVVGYHWSSSVNQRHAFTSTQISEAKQSPAIAPVTPKPVTPLKLEEMPLVSSDTSERREAQYLEEIDWLINENKDLKLALDVLNQESLDLNGQLLARELEISALESQSEPPTETRIVYNFVNVPIGGKIDSQPIRSQTVITQTNDTHTNNYASDLVASDNTAVGADAEYRQAQDYSQDDESYQNRILPGDDTAQVLEKWKLERQSYQTDSEILYDDDLGFYINPDHQYEEDEALYISEEGENMAYPPIVSE